MLADLHVHTTASDGTESPEGVVARAVLLGLGALAIADHDTMEGIPPAMEEGRRLGIDVLPAVEIGAEYGGREVHILGYMMDINDKPLLEELSFFRRARVERLGRIVGRLNDLGLPVTRERILEIAGSGSVGRPHIARALLETGKVGSVQEAFDLYLAEGKPGYEPRVRCDPARAVHLIRNAGGVPVIAHPGLSKAGELIPVLISEGLQGIEVYHPSHSPEAGEYYLGLCRAHGLLATGGSDYHGEGSKKHSHLGASTVHYRVVEQLRGLAEKNSETKAKKNSF
ncbi:MAG: PHP domain-containing protein [Bacillota bacterium]